ncbi:hypothetical protein QQ045_006321 [Rhodiola kirilowii]
MLRLRGGAKKRKKKTYTKPKKIKHKHRKVKLAVLQFYKMDDADSTANQQHQTQIRKPRHQEGNRALDRQPTGGRGKVDQVGVGRREEGGEERRL